MNKAATTRLAILGKAFELVYAKGYQATSIDDIIATTQVTKGAFFYHFKNKDDMGLAMINEIMLPVMKDDFVTALKNSTNPVKDIYGMIKHLLLENPHLQVKYGCPASNLVQEMAPLNKAFNKALAVLIQEWQDVMEASLRSGKAAGSIRKNVNPQQVSYFVMSGYWGIRNFGKLYGKNDCYKPYLKELKIYLESLQ